jgi:5-hydroxyisourate hydrolase-like protein (transthyretin family)
VAEDENGLQDVLLEDLQMDEGEDWYLEAEPFQDLGCPRDIEGYDCTVNATVVDNAGWENYSAVNVTIDDVPPFTANLTTINSTEGDPDTAKGEWYLDWQVNASDPSNMSATLYAENETTGEPIGNVSEMEPYNDRFRLIEQPAAFNASNGTYTFVAEVTDSAGNVNTSEYLLDISAQPPQIHDAWSELEQPEVDRETFTVYANVSDTNTIDVVNATFTWDGGEVVKTMELPEENENGENLTGGIYVTEFQANASGNYTLDIYAEDGTREVNMETFPDLFTAIGETSGELLSEPSFQMITNVTADSPEQVTSSFIFNNTGLATAYDTILLDDTVPAGTSSDAEEVGCDNVSENGDCQTSVDFNVSVFAEPGNQTVYRTAEWINPDGSSDYVTGRTVFGIEENPWLRETGGTVQADIWWNEPTNATEFKLDNFGNVKLEDVQIEIDSRDNDYNYLQDSMFETIPVSQDIEVGENDTTALETTIDTRGRYVTNFTVNATGNNCGETCVDLKTVDLSVYRKASVNLNLQGNAERGTYNLVAEVTDEEGSVEGYEVEFLDNGTSIATVETDNTGTAFYAWNTTQEELGAHNISARIEDNESTYYRAWDELDYGQITLLDSFNLDVTLDDHDMYWYDSREDHFVVFNVTALTRNGYPVKDANVTLTTNTSEGPYVTNCMTNASGYCDVLWNTSVSQPTTASATIDAEKEYFIDSNPYEDVVDILGGFSIEIKSPDEGESRDKDLDLVRNTSQLLNASVKNDQGDEVTPNTINWSINSTTEPYRIGDSKQTTWTVNDSLETGAHLLNVSADDQDAVTFDERTVEIYDPVDVNLLEQPASEAYRYNHSLQFRAEVVNTRTGDPVEGYTCRLENGGLVNTSVTDASGECSIRWNTTEEHVGTHSLSISVDRNTSGTWYLPEENSAEEFDVTLKENLSTMIDSPTGIIHRFTEEFLNATVENEFGPVDSNTTWYINGSEIAEGEDTTWNTGDFATGEYLLNASGQKTNYTRDNDSVSVEMYGYSFQEFNGSGEYPVGDGVPLKTRVTDLNTGEPLENYPVRFGQNRSSGFQEIASGQTSQDGWYNYTWDSTGQELGNYTVRSVVNDSSTLYYNTTQETAEEEVFIGGEMNVNVLEVSERKVFKDNFSEPQSTRFDVLVTDQDNSPVPNATVNFETGREIGTCETNSSFEPGTGECSLEWNPENDSQVGNLTVETWSEATNYFNSPDNQTFVQVKTAVRPEWENNFSETDYNFSTRKGVNLTQAVREEFTGRGVENYTFSAGIGERTETFQANLSTGNWDTTGDVNETDEGIRIINGSISQDVNLTDLDLIEARVENVTGEWNITAGDTSITGENAENISKRVNLDGTGLEITANGSIDIHSLEISDLDLENRRELMNSSVIGGENAFDWDDGDFETSPVRNSYQACESNSECILNGTYVGIQEGLDDSVEGYKDRGVYGSSGLYANISELPVNGSVSIVREHDYLPDENMDIQEYSMISFWVNSSIPGSLELYQDDGTVCTVEEQIGSTESWERKQFSLEGFRDSCGTDLGAVNLTFTNNDSETFNGTVEIDEMKLLRPYSTGANGTAEIDWLPSAEGTYWMKSTLQPVEDYNVSTNYSFDRVRVSSIGGGETAGDRGGQIAEDAPSKGGAVTSFIVDPLEFNETVAAETYGTFGTLEVENNATEPLDIGLSEVEGFEILNVTDGIELGYEETAEVPLRYNSSDEGRYNATLAVFNRETDERLDVNITFNVEPVVMELDSIDAENDVENITAGDQISLNSTVKFNTSEKITENVTWSVNVEDETCEAGDVSYSGGWNLSCKAPEIEYNPVNVTLEAVAEYEGLEIRDNVDARYRDVTPPFVTERVTDSVEKGENATVEIHAFDNNDISRVNGTLVYLENDTEMENVNFTEIEEGVFQANVSNTSYEGDYDVETELEDVNGHVRETTVAVSVFPFVGFEGDMTDVDPEFSFKRPDSGETLLEYQTGESYDFDVQNRTYDMEIKASADNEEGSQDHSLEFQDTEVSGNSSDPVSVSSGEIGETVQHEHPSGTTNRSFAAISIETNISFGTAKLDLNYSRTEDFDEENEQELRMFRCEHDDISQCSSEDWEQLESQVNVSDNIVSANTTETSSYILERLYTQDQESDEEESGDDGDSSGENSGGQTGPTFGGGLPGNETQTGDDTAEEPFILDPRIFQPVMFQGENRTFIMEVDNNRNEDLNLDINVTGEISELLSFSNTSLVIPANSSAITSMTASIPSDAETKTYRGSIVATYGNDTVESQQQILVSERGIQNMELNVETLTNSIPPGDNLTFNVELADVSLSRPVNASVQYMLRESTTDDIIKQENTSREISESISYQRKFQTDNLEVGGYYVQVVMQADNQTLIDTATFTIERTFWTPFRVRAILLILATLLISILGWKGYQYYWKKKEEESRYVFPVDYSRLPEDRDDNYWVGKIAETEKDAFIDPDDLTTHAIVSGSTGSGKSVTANVIAEEALENDVPVIVFDPTAQWTGFVKELRDDDLKEHYTRFEMDENDDPHPYRGVIKEVSSEEPDIDFEALRNPGEITVFTLNQLTTEQFDSAVRHIIDQIFDKEWEESPELEMLVVFDEVHRLLEEYGGKGGYRALERGAREFRKWGIGLMMCSQVTADFKQAISGNIMTEVQMQTKSMEDIDRVEKKYGEQFAKRISQEDVGVGMIQNSNYNDGDPWFVDFRPTYHNPHKIPDSELEQYHEISEMVDELRESIKAKKDAGENVRDLDLELQLAENKLKEGRFKMARMYIDSLKDEMDL